MPDYNAEPHSLQHNYRENKTVLVENVIVTKICLCIYLRRNYDRHHKHYNNYDIIIVATFFSVTEVVSG